ncbi:hypothetical protein Efla_000262 [Eimeria flavescens]
MVPLAALRSRSARGRKPPPPFSDCEPRNLSGRLMPLDCKQQGCKGDRLQSGEQQRDSPEMRWRAVASSESHERERLLERSPSWLHQADPESPSPPSCPSLTLVNEIGNGLSIHPNTMVLRASPLGRARLLGQGGPCVIDFKVTSRLHEFSQLFIQRKAEGNLALLAGVEDPP